jgi:hypothetical protein
LRARAREKSLYELAQIDRVGPNTPGILRSISAQDVIAQAIAIGQVESAFIKGGKPPEPMTGDTAAKRDDASGDEARQRARSGEGTTPESPDESEKNEESSNAEEDQESVDKTSQV